MSNESTESVFINSYKGPGTADQAYETMRQLEKEGHVDIRTAMTVTRQEDGKLKLVHKRRLTVGKGLVAGGGVGLLLFGPGAILAGMAIGAMAGATRSGQRAAVKDYLEDKLGPDESALVIIIKKADWDAVVERMEPFGGEHLISELSAADKAALDGLADNKEVVTAADEAVEVADDPNVEEVDESS
jgi:uncharacterized membrane protein